MNINSVTAGFILFCWAIWAVYWMVTALFTKRTLKGQSVWKWRVIVLASWIAAWIVVPLAVKHPIKNVALLPHVAATGIVADIVTLCGLIVALWARRVLGGNWSGGPVIMENHELIDRGPYAYIRHPIYSGMLLMVFGGAVFRGDMHSLVFASIIFVGICFLKARYEEKLLSMHFGEAYSEYKRRTKAFIPFVL